MKINISKKYKDSVVFDNFKLDIIEKKVNVILGPSGCGKTTLLHCIANITDYEGTIIVNNKKLSYIFQEDRLFPYLTVYKNLEIINSNKLLIDKYLSEFGVLDLKDKYPNNLSGGEKQRIAVIRAFLNEENVILMDEPFKSLDYNLKINLVELISKIQKETMNTIILVTHDLDVALYMGYKINVLSKKVTSVLESFINPYINQEINEESIRLRNKIKFLLK